MAKSNSENNKDTNINRREEINIKEFMLLDAKTQSEKIKESLEKMYDGKVNVNRNHIEKVLNIAFEPKDTEIYLPNNLRVSKENDKLIFSFKKKKNGLLILLFLLGFLFIGGFATYTGIVLYHKSMLNIDIDGDGVADINVDMNKDGICDFNCDINGDRKPDLNIDYQSNRRSMFNIKMDDGSIKNPSNQDIDKDGKCDINCDTNNDGWPDLNIDYDGDGIVDFDRDINNDGIKDLDLDTDGDGVCDLNCDDEPKDNICDRKCTDIEFSGNGGGSTSQSGDGSINAKTASLVVIFDKTDEVIVDMIYPDDQEGEEGINTKVPDMTWSVKNTTNKTLYYDIKWLDVYNDYESDNFWFKVESSNNGYNQSWKTVPKSDGIMATKVAILPGHTQTYRISWTLHGTGGDQNYDQNKIFRGKVQVDIIK